LARRTRRHGQLQFDSAGIRLVLHRLQRIPKQIDHHLPEQLFLPPDHQGMFRPMDHQSNLGMARGCPNRLSSLFRQKAQIHPFPRSLGLMGSPQKPLQIGFHLLQLVQGHGQRFFTRSSGAEALVQLDGHAGAGGRIAQLVGQADAQVIQGPEAFVLPDLGLVGPQLLAHPIDRQNQISEFIVSARHRHGFQLAVGNRYGALAEESEGLDDTACQHHRGQSGQQSGPATCHYAGPNRPPRFGRPPILWI
jgi:hypothetical protein